MVTNRTQAGAQDNGIPRFDGTSGRVIQGATDLVFTDAGELIVGGTSAIGGNKLSVYGKSVSYAAAVRAGSSAEYGQVGGTLGQATVTGGFPKFHSGSGSDETLATFTIPIGVIETEGDGTIVSFGGEWVDTARLLIYMEDTFANIFAVYDSGSQTGSAGSTYACTVQNIFFDYSNQYSLVLVSISTSNTTLNSAIPLASSYVTGFLALFGSPVQIRVAANSAVANSISVTGGFQNDQRHGDIYYT